MLPPLGRSRSQGSDTFCSGIIRQSKGVRGQLAVTEADRSLSVCCGLDTPKANQVAVRGHLMENANHTFLDAVRKSEREVRAQSPPWFGPRAR